MTQLAQPISNTLSILTGNFKFSIKNSMSFKDSDIHNGYKGMNIVSKNWKYGNCNL